MNNEQKDIKSITTTPDIGSPFGDVARKKRPSSEGMSSNIMANISMWLIFLATLALIGIWVALSILNASKNIQTLYDVLTSFVFGLLGAGMGGYVGVKMAMPQKKDSDK